MARPKIPDQIARQLRQEAGFGCCHCGLPIIQYHHIIAWEIEQHFRAEDMMVLCPTHHDMATKGALSEADQRELKRAPYNVQHRRAKGPLAVAQDYCAADLGSLTVVGEGPFLIIDGQPLLSFFVGAGNLELSLRIFDNEERLLVSIDRNEWVSGDPLPWDIQADWQRLIVRHKHYDIRLALDVSQIPMTVRGRFFWHGNEIRVDRNGIFVSNKGAVPIGFMNLAMVGTAINIHSDQVQLLAPKPDHGCLISWPNRREWLYRAREAWRRMRTERTPPNQPIPQPTENP